MVERDLPPVRRLVDDSLARDAIVFLEHSLKLRYKPGEIRSIFRIGRLAYGKKGPEGERYTADATHPVHGPSSFVFSIQEPNVIVISAYEKW